MGAGLLGWGAVPVGGARRAGKSRARGCCVAATLWRLRLWRSASAAEADGGGGGGLIFEFRCQQREYLNSPPKRQERALIGAGGRIWPAHFQSRGSIRGKVFPVSVGRPGPGCRGQCRESSTFERSFLYPASNRTQLLSLREERGIRTANLKRGRLSLEVMADAGAGDHPGARRGA